MLDRIFGRLFKGIPNRREVLAWGMYDLANQSFTLLVNTLFFAVYFREVIVAEPGRGDAMWGTITAVSMLLVVIASPLVGALADSRAAKKAFLVGTGLVCAALTCALGFTGPGMVAVAVLLYIPANFCYSIGENFLASFLPQIARADNMGRVSAMGWTMGYIGALLLLLISVSVMLLMGWRSVADWSPFFFFAGIWFLIFMVPSIRHLHETARPDPAASRANIVAQAHRRIKNTIRHARRYRQLMRFFAAFFLYGMGIWTVIFFAGIITREDFRFDNVKLVLFIFQLTVTAGIGAFATSIYQDRLGHIRTIMIFLGVWIVSTVGLTMMTLMSPQQMAENEWLFWVLGNGVGLGLGGIGTASRALVGVFTPAHKMAEFFGLWGMVYKSAGIFGPLAFGQLKGWLNVQYPNLSTPVPLLLLSGFFVVGLLLLLRVDEREGLAAARDAELELGLPPAQLKSPKAPNVSKS